MQLTVLKAPMIDPGRLVNLLDSILARKCKSDGHKALQPGTYSLY